MLRVVGGMPRAEAAVKAGMATKIMPAEDWEAKVQRLTDENKLLKYQKQLQERMLYNLGERYNEKLLQLTQAQTNYEAAEKYRARTSNNLKSQLERSKCELARAGIVWLESVDSPLSCVKPDKEFKYGEFLDSVHAINKLTAIPDATRRLEFDADDEL